MFGFDRKFLKRLATFAVLAIITACSQEGSDAQNVTVKTEPLPTAASDTLAPGPDLEIRTEALDIRSTPGETTADERLQLSESDQLLIRAQRPRFGDLDQIRDRRYLRVLVAFGRTNFFFDKGMPRGFEYDMLMEYEKSINEAAKSPEEKVKFVFIPVPFNQLLDQLIEGRGDIAAAGLTVTADRSKKVLFTDPYISNVNEVVVAHADGPNLSSLDDLAGQSVMVRRGSSYVAHLLQLNQRLVSEGKTPVRIVEADENLSTEDILEMVDAGAVPLTVADAHVASMWSALLKNIRIYPNLKIHEKGAIAWAIRPDSSQLLSSLNAFVRDNRKGSLMGNILFTRYYQKNRWITNPLSDADQARLREMRRLFEKYGAQYQIDWLELVAQGYQESQLDQSRRSSAGAIGVMQLLQSTASDRSVGIDDITDLENNIHAGAKYMAHLMNRYFNEDALDHSTRMDFAWASYNAGPNRIRRLRALAAERGLDPNRWFANVEVIAAEKIGRETVDYVRNINKYFVAYKLYFYSQQAGANTN